MLEEIDALADPAGRETAADAVAALVDLYGEGLRRIMAALEGEDSDELRQWLADDEMVSHLLLMHDLHPVPLSVRVQEALESVKPYLESHGGGVEIVGVEDTTVRLRLQGSCSGCPSSTMTLKLAIEDAIRKVAPEVEEIEAEGVVEEQAGGSGLLQLEVTEAAAAHSANGAGASNGGGSDPSWVMAGSLAELSGGGTMVERVAGEPLLFVRIEADSYAYRPACPGCEEPLEGAQLHGAELTCGACGHRYDVRRAGRCLDEPKLYLEPVPLLLDDSGLAKVALSGAAVA